MNRKHFRYFFSALFFANFFSDFANAAQNTPHQNKGISAQVVPSKNILLDLYGTDSSSSKFKSWACDNHPTPSIILIDDLSPDTAPTSSIVTNQFRSFSRLVGGEPTVITASSFLSKATSEQKKAIKESYETAYRLTKEILSATSSYGKQIAAHGGTRPQRIEDLPEPLKSQMIDKSKQLDAAYDKYKDLLTKAGFTKDAILAILKRLQPTDSSAERPLFFYYGHGERCEAGHWCTSFESIKLTETDIVNAVSPRGMFLESCFSGQAAKSSVLRTGTVNGDGIFLYTSALSNQPALSADGPDIVGLLSLAISQTAKSVNNPSICEFDLDHDGNISEREFATILLISFYKNEVAGSNRSPSRAELAMPLRKNLPQLPVSVVSDRCLLKIPEQIKKKCAHHQQPTPNAQQPLSPEVRQCSTLIGRSKNLSASIEKIIDGKSLDYLWPQGGVVPYSTAEKKIYAEVKGEAVAYIKEWQSQLQNEKESCEKILGLNSADLCQNLNASFNQINKTFKNIMDLVLNLRSPKN
jgi:hypothetical protein